MSDLTTPVDITRLLLDVRGVSTFNTAGYCMFPCLRPGDRITVDARAIEQISVGEIAVFQRDKKIVAHRVVEAGKNGGVHYLVTRPDRASRNEAPLYAADVLGVVTRVQRRERDVDPAARPLPPLARQLVDIYLACACSASYCARKAAGALGLLQESALYRAIAPRLAAEFTVRVPLLSNVDDLYRCFPLPEVPVDLLRDASNWSIVLSRNGDCAATLTIERDAGCRDAWWIRNASTRLRYRGLGFEDRLLAACETCLSRLAPARLCIALPAAPALLRAARREGFTANPPNSMILMKTL